MNSRKISPPIRYAPFEQSHIAPLRDVTPDALKLAAKQLIQDREAIQLTTAQNILARKLGVDGGFAEYREEYDSRLRQFMQDNQLECRCDLITPHSEFPIVSLTPRQVSDGLFLSGRELPVRVFTGYNVDWYGLNNRYFRYNPWREHPSFKNFWLPYGVVLEAVRKAKDQSPDAAVAVLESAVAACYVLISAGANLLGEQLLSQRGEFSHETRFIPRLYKQETMTAEEFHAAEQQCREVWRFFRLWIDQLSHGWVQVLPYNSSLVFLKGERGLYDFLFPRFRDEEFDHNPFMPYLRNDDVPKSHDAYHFRRWLYYEYKGWLEEDKHHSELSFYCRGNMAVDYPTSEHLLRQHLIAIRKYSPPTKPAKCADGFQAVLFGKTPLYVSDLITISQFLEFMSRNRDYAFYREELTDVDNWETVNSDSDQTLPAAVTWYDANAYAAWISKTKHLPVRLLTLEEFQQISNTLIAQSDSRTTNAVHIATAERLVRFSEPDGTPINGHPPYMDEVGFQSLLLHYDPSQVAWGKTSSGLRILMSHDFGEWLNDIAGAAINPLTGGSLSEPTLNPLSAPFNATSCGKYKSKKIGFRLCYLGESGKTNSEASESKGA